MKKLILMLLFVFITQVAFAGGFAKVGGDATNRIVFNNKLITLGYQHKFFYLFDYQLEAGNFSNHGKSLPDESYFVGSSVGVSLVQHSWYAKSFIGPALVTPTNVYLNTPIELNTDLELGLRDHRGLGMGVGYKHMSNGGVTTPNLGRDFLFLKIQLP